MGSMPVSQQETTQRVSVARERLHLLEHRRPGWRQYAADHDIADLAAGVGTDDGDCAHGPHDGRL
jgi:hypothetical protein